VPNKDLANSRIVNHVFPTPLIGITLEVGVAYGSDYGNSALNSLKKKGSIFLSRTWIFP